MLTLIRLLVMSIPMYTIGRFTDGGAYVNVTQLLMVLVVVAGTIKVLHTGHWIPAFDLSTNVFLFVFVISVVEGMIASPFGAQSLSKGLVQFAGILTALMLAAFVSMELSRRPEVLVSLARCAAISFGLFAVVAIAQFIVWNTTPFQTFLTFGFLDDIAGGEIWRGGGMIGPLFRASAWATEPAHFTRYLGFALSLALVRSGCLGIRFKNVLKSIIPLWAALSIVAAYAVAISLLGLIQVCMTLVLLVPFTRRVRAKALLIGVSMVAIAGMTMFLFVVFAGPPFTAKIASISLLWNPDSVEKTIDTEEISMLAVSWNLKVAIDNMHASPLLGGGLGSHAFAYEIYVPEVVYRHPNLYGLNSVDAAGLGARLLSETGWIGLVSLTGLFLSVVLAARTAALARLERLEGGMSDPVPLLQLCFGVSLLTVFLMYFLRAGQYFDPLLYVLLGIVASASVKHVARVTQRQFPHMLPSEVRR
ncbi:hypothetical protein [Paraburkholderia sp. BCC1876]|uniref:hypothetical protein n=1 Tax=Paraburkholderia sp. BCC1876 TaxID=2676303 RepID=UPI00159037D4|nr:hypothetical protein [Paraburkholderia sp. BCC1876]